MKELAWTAFGIVLMLFVTEAIMKTAPMMAGFVLFVVLSMVVKFLSRKNANTEE